MNINEFLKECRIQPEDDTETRIAKKDARATALFLERAGINLEPLDTPEEMAKNTTPSIKEISKQGKVKPTQVKQQLVLKVKLLTMSKKIALQVPFIWSPTRKMFDEGQVLGIAKARALDTVSSGWVMLIQDPQGNLVWAKVHFNGFEWREYKQIYLT